MDRNSMPNAPMFPQGPWAVTTKLAACGVALALFAQWWIGPSGGQTLSTAQATEVPNVSQPNDGPFAAGKEDWLLFRGDAMASGVAQASLPDKPELLWKKSYPELSFPNTVAIAGGVIFAPTHDGKLLALSLADGSELWTFRTELGFASPPSVADGKIYIGDVEGTFYCILAADGTLVWKVSTGLEINSGANFYKDKVLFGSQDGSLYCLNTSDGSQAWVVTTGDQIRSFPTRVENLAFVAGCDGQLHIIDCDKGEETGTVDIQGPTGCSPCVAGDQLFLGTEGGLFLGINWRTKTVDWEQQAERSGASFRSSGAVAGDLVIVGGRDKRVHAYQLADGQPAWDYPVKKNVDGSPVIVGDRAFFGGSDGRLVALNVKTGAEGWVYEAGGAFTASPAVAKNRLVIGSEDGSMFCFGAK